MTCKDCFHYQVCGSFGFVLDPLHGGVTCCDFKTKADVVEVVRCKDCKDYRQNPYSPEEDMMCMCWCDWLPTDPDDFCSYGKRR